MRRLGSFLIITLVAVAALLVVAPRTAWASCHAFTIEANPAYVREGGTVGVTVRRDGGGGSGSVRVSSVNESAEAGPDFEAVDRQITLGLNDTYRTFPLVIRDDSGHEGDESFRLHLSSPRSCTFGGEATAGPDARVTIQDNDPAPAPAPRSPTTTAAPNRSRATTTTTTRSRVARATSSASGSSRRSASDDESVPTDDDQTTTTTAKPRTATRVPEITVPTLPPTTKPDRSEAALEVSSTGPNRAGAIAVATLSVLTVLATGGYGLYRRRSFRV